MTPISYDPIQGTYRIMYCEQWRATVPNQWTFIDNQTSTEWFEFINL